MSSTEPPRRKRDLFEDDPYLFVMAILATLIVGLLVYVWFASPTEPERTNTMALSPVACPDCVCPPPHMECEPSEEPLRPDPFQEEAPDRREEGLPWEEPVAAKCAWTRVTARGPRLTPDPGESEHDYSSGVGFAFANGVGLVSYNATQDMLRTTVGTRVQVCLFREMRGCPPGDDRGKEYRVYDPVHKVAWSMADSQHSCGGA